MNVIIATKYRPAPAIIPAVIPQNINAVSVGSLIAMSLLCGVIAMLCDYMKRVLDYTAVEKVQFEDDDFGDLEKNIYL